MSDIVERLRREAENQRSLMENRGDERIAALVSEAADEIARLRNAPIDQKLQWRLDEIIERLRNAGL